MNYHSVKTYDNTTAYCILPYLVELGDRFSRVTNDSRVKCLSCRRNFHAYDTTATYRYVLEFDKELHYVTLMLYKWTEDD